MTLIRCVASVLYKKPMLNFLKNQLLGGSDYQSDATGFLQQLRQQDPHLLERQKAGHALLWYPQLAETAEHRALQKGFESARLAQQPYVYATQPARQVSK